MSFTLQSCEAVMGNSDLHRPLRSCQLLSCDDPLNVFVVSDGHWSDMSTLMSSMQRHSQLTRVFTLGVGLVPLHNVVIYLSLSGQAPPYLADDIHLVSEGPSHCPPTDHAPFHTHTRHLMTGALLSLDHVCATAS